MRALTVDEMEFVQGVGLIENLVTSGLFSENSIAAASRLATGLGLIAGAATVGWKIGELLVEYTPVEEWASWAIEYYIRASVNGYAGCY